VKWPGLPSTGRLAAWALGALAALAAGIAIGVHWQAPRIAAAESHAQAVAASLVANHQTYVATQEREAREAREEAQREAEERERVLQADLDKIRADAGRRGPARVRVYCPPGAAGAAAPGDRAPGPAVGAPTATDGPGVGADGEGGDRAPHLELDVGGIWAIVDQGKAVSAQLRACQGAP
jgi:hypothetical protein